MSPTQDKTALITGASSGLGAEFARQLAAQNYDLLLIARRKERLEALAASLQAQYGIGAEAFPADLSNPADLERVEHRLDTLEQLELLVNNAGFGIRGGFSRGELAPHLDMIQVHVIASIRLVHRALPGMLQRGHGGVINVSSIAAFLPVRSVTYSATKAYLVTFSQALQTEISGSGVQIQALCPGFTYTEFHNAPGQPGSYRPSLPKILWLTPKQVVRTSLRDLQRGRVISVPGWAYALIVGLARHTPAGALVLAISLRLLGRRRQLQD